MGTITVHGVQTDEMAKSNDVPFFVHLFNPIVRGLHRVGIPMGPTILLTVRGRKTGKPRTTPVGLFDGNGRRYVFATFGEVDWVRNLRSAGEALISRGRRREAVVAIELKPEEAALVLQEVLKPYLASRIRSSFLRMGYDLGRDPSKVDFMNVALHHPGFELLGP